MPTRLLLRLAFGIVIVGVVIRGLYLLHSFDEGFAKADAIVHAQERRMQSVDRTSSLVVDLETGVRGWLLTREPAFRYPYDRASAELPHALAELEDAHGSDDASRVAAIRSAVREWDERVAAPLLGSKPTETEAVALHEDGKRRMDGIRADLGAMRTRSVQRGRSDILRDELGHDVIVDIVAFTLVLVVAFVALGAAVVRMIELPLVRLAAVASGDAPLSVAESLTGVREVRGLARVLRERQARLDEARAREKRFADMLGVLAEGGELATVASAALRNVVDDQGVLFGAIWVVRKGGTLERVAVTGLAAELPTAPPPLVEEVCRSGRRRSVDAVDAKGDRVLRTTGVDVVPRRLLVAPLMVGGHAVGAVELGGDVSDARAEELDRMLPRVALALANILATDEVVQLGENLARTNEELYAQNEELRAQEDELRAQRELLLANEERLSAQTTELAKASQAKTEFLSTVSHELRTPLNAIVGFTEVLLHGKEAEPSAQRRRYLADVQDAARHLHKLVDDLLDLGRVEAGVLQVREGEVMLRDAVGRALALVHPEAGRKRIFTSFDVPEELCCAGDPPRVKQVFANLLANAIKFTPEGGGVAIRGEARDGWARVEVSDSGPGIDPADVPKLFQQFAQLPVGIAAKSGFGLGLAISKQLVERMGGRIEVRSRHDGQKGAVFVVELPLRQGTERRPMLSAPVKAAAWPSAPPAPVRISRAVDGAREVLVVSSKSDDVDVLRDLLSRAQYTVTHVGADEAAVFDALDRKPIALAIVDVGTQGGADILAKIAARAPIPLVALTDAPPEPRAAHALRAHGALLVEKGVMTGAGFTDLLETARARGGLPLVLVVDDNDVNRRVARAMLEDAKLRVVEADSAEPGLELAKRLRPDVILMDIRMPGTSGIDATRRLRSDPSTADIPVIAVSAQAMVGDQKEALDAGCAAYVTKPVGRQELVSAVNAALERRAAEAALRAP